MNILVALSGGVDSSVSAALLLEAGHDVVGGFIKNWSDTKDLWTGECAWRVERRDALRVTAKLGISLLTFDFEEQYRSRVLEKMFAEYEAGRTPNPDILCNQEIKFGLFFEEARRLGFDAIATGHYARVSHDERGAHLLRGNDSTKDQSYFLQRMSREALAHTLFPIGHLKKTEVRTLAERFSLPVAQKPDSQGICFVGKLDMPTFLRKRIPSRPGAILDEMGRVLGTHDGLDAYTIGQRHGLGVSLEGKTWYVAKKHRVNNTLSVVSERNHPWLFPPSFSLEDVHWLQPAYEKVDHFEGDIVARYHQAPIRATIHRLDATHATLTPHTPLWAPASGQSVAIYLGSECLGGGVLMEDTLA